MSRSAVARNYAEALLELASREDAEERYGELLDGVAALHRGEPRFRLFLETPRVPLEAKQAAIREALGEDAPELLVRFLLVVLEKRRQRAIPAIAEAYRGLLDEKMGRVHALVALPFEADDALRRELLDALQRTLGRTVVPHFSEDPRLLGGVRVRVGDRVMDGSLRRRLEDLRAELMRAGRDGRN